jgi:hydroquinone glucosyltransferase
VPDFFCYEALPFAAELDVPGYIFYPTNLATHTVIRRVVALNDGATYGYHRGLPDPLQLSGHVLLRRADIPVGFEDSTEPHFALLLDMGRRYRAAAGFLVNSFYAMENATAEEIKLAAEKDAFPPAYPLGPLLRSSSDEDDDASTCMNWLDCQPTGSVVYVSFGSVGALSMEQTAELAAGLEGSGHRFLWVVCMPSLRDGRSDKEDP